MKKLDKIIFKGRLSKNPIQWIQVKRSRRVAMYEQHFLTQEFGEIEEDIVVAYEVFKIEVQKEISAVIGGVEMTFEEKERFPCDEDFGRIAFTFRTMELAEQRYDEMISVYEKSS